MKIPQSTKTRIISIEEKMLTHGLRLTRLRQIILKILAQTKQHLNVAQIHQLACGNEYYFAVASIYRNINSLVVIGLVEVHQFKKGYATYELAGPNPHDHLIDLDSGQVIEFHSVALDQLKAEIAKQHGYRFEACHIEFYAYPEESSAPSL